MFDHKTNVVSQADFSYGNFERIEKTSQALSLQQLENTQKSETKKTKENCKKHKGSWRTSIGVKLISIISSLVVLSMALITFLVSFFVTSDTKAHAENSNFTLNSRIYLKFTTSSCVNWCVRLPTVPRIWLLHLVHFSAIW